MQVIRTPEVDAQIEHSALYLELNFGSSVADRYLELLHKSEQLLASMPYIGSPIPDRPFYRSLVIHPNCRLIYYLASETIVIADLWDTRQGGWT